MNYYGLEVKIDTRRNTKEFEKTHTLIQSMILDKLSDSNNFNCAICNNNLTSEFNIAYRVFKKEKKVVAHPVHKNCIKEGNNFFNTSNFNKGYTDVSKTDYCDMIKLMEVLKDIDKNI